jgi:hypothetical protein
MPTRKYVADTGQTTDCDGKSEHWMSDEEGGKNF